MVYRILIAVLIGVVGCKREAPEGDAPAESTAAEEGKAPAETTGGQSEVEGRGASLGQGTNTLFGIKIPTGMVPAKGPVKVFRFEGKQSMAQVTHLIKKQVRFKEERREGEGVLFRFAKVVLGKQDRALAIRIFEQGGNTTLDIWKEKSYKEKLPDAQSRAAYRGVRVEKRKPMAVTEARRANVQQRRKEAMTIMRKLEKREPLTREEYTSELFD